MVSPYQLDLFEVDMVLFCFTLLYSIVLNCRLKGARMAAGFLFSSFAGLSLQMCEVEEIGAEYPPRCFFITCLPFG
jgi:hypothetical protein